MRATEMTGRNSTYSTVAFSELPSQTGLCFVSVARHFFPTRDDPSTGIPSDQPIIADFGFSPAIVSVRGGEPESLLSHQLVACNPSHTRGV